MKIKSRESSVPAGLFSGRFLPAFFLTALCALLTGCPYSDYTVELKPTAQGVERTLTFFRADGGDSNGVPYYLEFPAEELAAITKAYPAGAVKTEGRRQVAKGEFAGAMPKDIGGAGSFTNYVTSLGESGFYMERFRGEDDLAARTLKQYHAADQFTDLVLGWSKKEFGGEKGYKKLRTFLDGDFRHDLKNAGQYFQAGALNGLANTNATEEYVARFGQYLIERGYVNSADAPSLPAIISGDSEGTSALLGMFHRLMVAKMTLPDAPPSPTALAIMTNAVALQKSWKEYLAHSDLYRAKHKVWEAKLKANPELKDPEPEPELVADVLFMELLGMSGGFEGESDRLTVKMMLKRAPDHSNGKWKDGYVIWEDTLYPKRPVPVLCYASWNVPDETFQKAHFGRVLLEGDNLSEYDLWRSGLAPDKGREWDAFVAGLQPGHELKAKIEAYHLIDGENSGRKLLTEALAKNAEAMATAETTGK